MKLVKSILYNAFFSQSFDEKVNIEHTGKYLVEISATAKNWWQNTTSGRSFLKKDSLTITVDNEEIIALPKKKKIFADDLWNGNLLKGGEQIVYVAEHFESGSHLLSFIVRGKPFISFVKVYLIESEKIELTKLSANKRDRIPWLIFLIGKGLSVSSLLVTARVGKDFFDDDDLGLKINNAILLNSKKYAHKEWYWCGKILAGSVATFKQEFTQSEPLVRIDLLADGNPLIETLSLVFSKNSSALIGRIALHLDIEKTDFARLREGPRIVTQEIAKLKNGEEVQIIEERVTGEWIPSRSYIWHKVLWKSKIGFIHSSFVEIDGQERNSVIIQIKDQSKVLNLDQDVALALAGCESLYKPFATSRAFEDKDVDGDVIAAKGIFQLTKPAIQQLQKNTGKYHYVLSDAFDVTQNIHAGIRYAAWLYDTYYRGMSQSVEKLVAAYNAGQWKIIILAIILSIAIPAYAQSFYGPKEDKIFKLVPLSPTTQLPSTRSFPTVFADEENAQLLFFDSQKKEVKQFPISRLAIDDIADVPNNQHSDQLIYIGPDVIEYPAKVFYFSIATSWECGVDNCGWMIIQYNANNDTINVIAKDVLASSLNFLLSPYGSHMAITSHFAAGVCNGSAFIDILDLHSNRMDPVRGFKDAKYSASSSLSLVWVNDSTLEFKVRYSCDTHRDGGSRDRIFNYNSSIKKLQLLYEKYYSSGG